MSQKEIFSFETVEPIVYFKSSEFMDEIGNNSIQLIITSPPYGKIKDYGAEDQIGFSDSFEEYFKRLKNIWKECYRILEPHCRMIINVGDQYLRTTEYGRYRILSISSKVIDDCLELGFDFLGDIIWQKISTTNTTGGCSLMGSIYYPRNGLLTFDYEHILIFKKREAKERKIDLKTKELSKISLSEWKKWYIGHWRFSGTVQKEHVAMFPEELPYRLIRMFSFIGDTVLDPFLGSGTTLKVAKSLYRKGIGYEINENFRAIIENKVREGKEGYFKDYQFLISVVYKKGTKENIKINFDKQKQKGIIILENDAYSEVVLDYLMIDNEVFEYESILKELRSKIEENPIQNYINEKEKWNHFLNYVVVINTNFLKNQELVLLINDFIKSISDLKIIQFLLYDQIISNDFQLSTLFDNNKKGIKPINSLKKRKDILSFLNIDSNS